MPPRNSLLLTERRLPRLFAYLLPCPSRPTRRPLQLSCQPHPRRTRKFPAIASPLHCPSYPTTTMAPSADYFDGQRYSSTAVPTAAVGTGVPNFAFAFEYDSPIVPALMLRPLINWHRSIDGVLLRSSGIIPRAAEALRHLHDNDIPFILLTNGGGKHESARVKELSKKLGIPITEENFVQSHTPFKQLVEGSETTESLKDKTILVTGGDGDACRQVAEM